MLKPHPGGGEGGREGGREGGGTRARPLDPASRVCVTLPHNSLN